MVDNMLRAMALLARMVLWAVIGFVASEAVVVWLCMAIPWLPLVGMVVGALFGLRVHIVMTIDTNSPSAQSGSNLQNQTTKGLTEGYEGHEVSRSLILFFVPFVTFCKSSVLSVTSCFFRSSSRHQLSP